MSKKLAFILFALSFVAGFALRDMLSGIASESDSPKAGSYSAARQIGVELQNNEPPLEITRYAFPRKAMRGSPFELVVSLKTLKRLYGKYSLVLYARNVNSQARIKVGQINVEALNGAQAGTIMNIGPVMIELPEEISSGKYHIEFEAAREWDGNDACLPVRDSSDSANHNDNTIEVVRYGEMNK